MKSSSHIQLFAKSPNNCVCVVVRPVLGPACGPRVAGGCQSRRSRWPAEVAEGAGDARTTNQLHRTWVTCDLKQPNWFSSFFSEVEKKLAKKWHVTPVLSSWPLCLYWRLCFQPRACESVTYIRGGFLWKSDFWDSVNFKPLRMKSVKVFGANLKVGFGKEKGKEKGGGYGSRYTQY